MVSSGAQTVKHAQGKIVPVTIAISLIQVVYIVCTTCDFHHFQLPKSLFRFSLSRYYMNVLICHNHLSCIFRAIFLKDSKCRSWSGCEGFKHLLVDPPQCSDITQTAEFLIILEQLCTVSKTSGRIVCQYFSDSILR